MKDCAADAEMNSCEALYSRNYIGCPSNTASATRQLHSISRFAACPRRHISTAISRVQTRQHAPDTQSSATPALFKPFTRTNYTKHTFRCSAPAVCNSLPRTVLDCITLSTFKSKLKTFLFSHTHTFMYVSLQCFNAVGWAAGRASGL